MKIKNYETKQKFIQRLRRIGGQLRGVEAMVADERDCQDIMQQLTSINSAMQGASRLFLQDYAITCLRDMDEQNQNDPEYQQRREKLVSDMLALFLKTP
ncbi:MAG: metal-sensitive transcriptional regulator [Anaerolineales bacterium]